ncbi:MAG TPA: hypothetical protein VG965_06700 [Patescibacteria group bacterium]|nr:hypothetical protein [Patescibacteria group bacterium]
MSTRPRLFLPFAVIITGLCALVFVAGQQMLRAGANDPQIEISQDVANSLSAGRSISSLNLHPGLDLATTISTFIIIFNDNGTPAASEVTLAGSTPQIPPGVLDYTKRYGQDRITWQPAKGIRVATIVTRFKSTSGAGFVLVGRGLTEAERRVDQLLTIVSIAWLVLIIATFAAMHLLEKRITRN